jgi:hypothetical protein
MLLTAVTVGATARCTDVVAFTFRSSSAHAPGVRVSMVNPPFTQAGSGERVTVAGETFFAVRFEPASAFDVESGQPSYTGPKSIVGSGSQVRAVVNTEAFEGVVTWIVGVRAGDGFSYTTKSSPPSLILTFGSSRS